MFLKPILLILMAFECHCDVGMQFIMTACNNLFFNKDAIVGCVEVLSFQLQEVLVNVVILWVKNLDVYFSESVQLVNHIYVKT